ncbi:MAG: two-component system, NtrC family, response regulator [Bryobacterales bacterium]|nr:two-component system, NtrC family, response regulator [Bryobacterales bacterium]
MATIMDSTPDPCSPAPVWRGCRSPVAEAVSGATALISSPSLRSLFAHLRLFAKSACTVLIEGESGTGKELVARAVHHFSPRAHKPFVDVSCAALPDHLAESELFGFERGAFSGADAAKPGFFELACGGSLFLDEIGELDLKMQAKLLRVLDAQPYYRLGGTRKVPVDARIIAATNRNLEEMVAAGRFRKDLYHRLAQFQVSVPPLRDRREDIAPLAEFFLQSLDTSLVFSPEAMAALERHSWPGNVRELKNAVTNCAILAAGPVITSGDLPDRLKPARQLPRTQGTLQCARREMIREALTRTGGHHQRAAQILGISRRTLSRQLKQDSATSIEHHGAIH